MICMFKVIHYYVIDVIDMLLMVEKGISNVICHTIHKHAKEKYKYMKDYDKNKESSYIQYLDAKNFYRMSKCNENFIKNYGEDSDKGYILK